MLSLPKGREGLNIAHQREDKNKYWQFILQCLDISCRGLASVAWHNIIFIANGKKFTTFYVMDMQDMSEKKKECQCTMLR